jgi:hypothetical protein
MGFLQMRLDRLGHHHPEPKLEKCYPGIILYVVIIPWTPSRKVPPENIYHTVKSLIPIPQGELFDTVLPAYTV